MQAALRILILISLTSVMFLATWIPESQGAPQTYFYGTANINAPFAIHNFAMDNRSVNDALPMFLNKGRAASPPMPAPKVAMPGTKTAAPAKDAAGKDKSESDKTSEKDYEDYSN